MNGKGKRRGQVRFLTPSPVAAVDPVACTPQQMRTIHMLVAALLEYPEERFAPALDAYEQVRDDLPQGVQAHLDAFVDWAASRPRSEIAVHYVDTFDQQRRTALYLSYYVAGDTRLRGSAILGFKEFINAMGYENDNDELDDYLPVILELSATSGDPMVWELLASHRDGIEVMRSALHGVNSPYAHLLDALAVTLPEVSDEVIERFQRLVSQGPPTEMVGVHQPLAWSKS